MDYCGFEVLAASYILGSQIGGSYTNHFIGVRSVVNTHSIGLGLQLEESGWTMSTASVQNQG